VLAETQRRKQECEVQRYTGVMKRQLCRKMVALKALGCRKMRLIVDCTIVVLVYSECVVKG
jgi:hypothetical protein